MFLQLITVLAIVLVTSGSRNFDHIPEIAPKSSDLVSKLPGIEFPQNSAHYSGFLHSINNTKLHYWFFESARAPSTDPVILWLNGGPGCSSLIGALSETGPIRLGPDGRISPNPHSWNARANLLFLETPTGVGFSYSSQDGPKMALNDDFTAELNIEALHAFFQKFPGLLANDFYIAGESYAGVYVPTLAKLAISRKFPPNFRAVAIGNGYLSRRTLENSRLHYLYSHGIIGFDDWTRLIENCCPGVSGSRLNTCDFYAPEAPGDCVAVRNKYRQLPVDPYNIYDSATGSLSGMEFRRRWNSVSSGEEEPEVEGMETEEVFESREYLAEYLNKDAVREALHVESSVQKWTSCQSFGDRYKQQYPDMGEHIRLLISQNIRVLIYNGDLDTVCDFLGVQWFIRSLGVPSISEYGPWFYGDFVVGGMFQKFQQGLSFVTVMGAGHLVPADKPEAALNMLDQFLFNSEGVLA